MAETVLKVSGMSCGHCQKRVFGALMSLEGVEEVEVDLATGTVRVLHQPGNPGRESMAKAVAGAGYEVAP
jgi:copper chaperone